MLARTLGIVLPHCTPLLPHSYCIHGGQSVAHQVQKGFRMIDCRGCLLDHREFAPMTVQDPLDAGDQKLEEPRTISALFGRLLQSISFFWLCRINCPQIY